MDSQAQETAKQADFAIIQREQTARTFKLTTETSVDVIDKITRFAIQHRIDTPDESLISAVCRQSDSLTDAELVAEAYPFLPQQASPSLVILFMACNDACIVEDALSKAIVENALYHLEDLEDTDESVQQCILSMNEFVNRGVHKNTSLWVYWVYGAILATIRTESGLALLSKKPIADTILEKVRSVMTSSYAKTRPVLVKAAEDIIKLINMKMKLRY